MSLCPVRLEVWATFTSPCCQTWLSRSLETTACCWRVQASPSGGFSSTHLIPVFHCNPNLWSYWFAQWVRAGFILELLVWHESFYFLNNVKWNRGLFLIDPSGVVKHMSINDLPVGRSVEETLRLVKAFQYVETHGEVCPASWTPESPTVSFYMSNCWDAVGMVISGTWARVRYVRSSCQGHWKLVLNFFPSVLLSD